MEIDLSTELGKFEGMGANVPISFYSRRLKALQTFNELGVKYIRVKRVSDNWDDILALRGSTQRLHIKWIYSLDAIPANFTNEYGQLVDIEGFAGWWAEEVDELLYQEVPADYIELLDVPDIAPGDSLPMSSDTYNALVHATKEELTLRGFDQVGIVGPGLSTPGISGDMETWYMDLDEQVFETLDFWTVQMWENRIDDENLSVAFNQLTEYLDTIESRKPIFVSEYASTETNFGKIQYPDPGAYDQQGNLSTFKTYYYSASFTMPYALRVYSNTLDLLKQAAVIPFIYQMYDAPADVKFKKQSWGLLDLNGEAKPVFTLLANLMKRIPDNASVVKASYDPQHNFNALAFDNGEKLVLTVCNQDESAKSIQINISSARRSLELTGAVASHSPELFSVELGQRDVVETVDMELKLRHDEANNSQFFTISVEPQSTMVAEFQYK
ncbi:hypothetical protein HQ531_13685 [bacterium]|nr:hypothetical protein [bacterium]